MRGISSIISHVVGGVERGCLQWYAKPKQTFYAEVNHFTNNCVHIYLCVSKNLCSRASCLTLCANYLHKYHYFNKLFIEVLLFMFSIPKLEVMFPVLNEMSSFVSLVIL